MKITFHNVPGTIDVYMDCLRAICGDTEGKSMIDLCCCTAPNTPKLGFAKRVYVDVMDRKLDHADEQQFFYKGDVTDFKFYPNNWFPKFDVAICSDGIEHLSTHDGQKLLYLMDINSHKQIIFTPTTDLFGLNNDDTPEAHRSVWSPEMMPGYAALVFPDFHKEWNGGAFFAWRCKDIQQDYQRVVNELMTKSWANNIKIESE